MDDFISMQNDKRFELGASSEKEKAQHWVPLLEGWIKVNVNASHCNTKAALAFAIKDHKGKLLLLSTMILSCTSSFLAEVKGLKWASDYATTCSWGNIVITAHF